MKKTIAALVVSALFAVESGAAGLIWDEAIDGDLSGDYLNPTTLFLNSNTGEEDVLFTTVGGNPNQDREYFTFTIPSGYQLSSLKLVTFETDPASNLGFIGVAAGSVFPTPPTSPDPTTLLGYALIGNSEVGTDILQSIGTGPGSQGFAGPLAAGSYTWWAQETGPSTDDWELQFSFAAAAVPEPSAALLWSVGFLGLLRPRRR